MVTLPSPPPAIGTANIPPEENTDPRSGQSLNRAHYFLYGKFLNKWLQESVRCQPNNFSLWIILKFIIVLYCMMIMYYPLHRMALPFIHEFGHYFFARTSDITPVSFVVGNIHNPRLSFKYAGTDFYIGPDSGGSQVTFEHGYKTCLVAAGGPLFTFLLSFSIFIWIKKHRGKPITILYVIMWAFGLDAMASTLINLFSNYPGSDGVFLRSCFPFF